jgi:hypothetical protein
MSELITAQQFALKWFTMPNSKSDSTYDYHDLFISAIYNENKRVPSNIVLVIDVSGSMDNTHSISSETSSQFTYLTTLSIVNHAIKTIIGVASAEDYISIVTFSDYGETKMPLTRMDADGKLIAYRVTDNLRTEGGTNIWGGVESGMNEALKNNGNNTYVMLLTDGQPSCNPAEGYVKALANYKMSKGGELPAVLNTFGFGNNLESQILDDLANNAGGKFAFIPDVNFTGTVFINSAAGTLVSNVKNLKISIEGVETIESNEISRPSLQSSQKIEYCKTIKVLKNVNPNEHLRVSATYVNDGCIFNRCVGVESVPENQRETQFRLQFVEETRQSLKLLRENYNINKAHAQSLLSNLIRDIRTSGLCPEFLQDVEEQAYMAISTEAFFKSWGKHYLTSLVRTHELQECNNFKDPGVQMYGGDAFKSLRDEAEEIFLAIPSPVPVKQLINRSGGCVGGNSTMTLIDGSVIRAQDVKKNHILESGVKVLCVLKTNCADGEALLCTLPQGLEITPHHPVFWEGAWTFPASIVAPELKPCDALYTFLTDKESFTATGVMCIGLNHGIENDHVASHPFFGTQLVVDNMMLSSGWASGLVQVSFPFKRDPVTNIVNGLNLDE